MKLSPNSHMKSPCHSDMLDFDALMIFCATRSNFEREFLHEFFELESEDSINLLLFASSFQRINCCIATSSSSGCVNYGQFQTAENVHCKPLDSTSDFSVIFSKIVFAAPQSFRLRKLFPLDLFSPLYL